MSDLIEKKTFTVYVGRNKPHKLQIKDAAGLPVKFVDLGSALSVTIDGKEYKGVDGYVAFDNEGWVTFTLGGIVDPPLRTKDARLVWYHADAPLGEPIFAEDTPYRIAFKFI